MFIYSLHDITPDYKVYDEDIYRWINYHESKYKQLIGSYDGHAQIHLLAVIKNRMVQINLKHCK